MIPKRTFTESQWQQTPPEVRQAFEALELEVERQSKALSEANKMIGILLDRVADILAKNNQLAKRVEELEARVNKNSGNSNKPPSSDSPFTKPGTKSKPEAAVSGKKRGAKPGHKGHRQQFLAPTEQVDMLPGVCKCGCCDLVEHEPDPFYIHQEIGLPEIRLDVRHFRLFRAKCKNCGRKVKGKIPPEHRTGYDPRLSALIAFYSGVCGDSREMVQEILDSVYGVPISLGGIQRVVDRASQAIEPVYDEIGSQVRTAPVAFVDETPWYNRHKLEWLWTMTNQQASWFMIHKNRSEEAFQKLIADWQGILVSDNYGVYRKWAKLRQTCIAHYVRRARKLSELSDPELAHFGKRLLAEFSLLCTWNREEPTQGQWRAFIARFMGLLRSHENRDDEAGLFARLILAEIDCLWVFLEEKGVEPTNNRAERAIRPGVMQRKRSLGTQSEKGDRWIERVLSLRQTCRIRKTSSFNILVDAFQNFFAGRAPNLDLLVPAG